MKWLLGTLFLVAAVAATCSFTLAVEVFGPDREDTADRAFWAGRGDVYNLPMVDAKGNMYVRQTKFCVANSGLIPAHAADQGGRSLPHVHFMHDYQAGDMGDADRYWDGKSDCPQSTKRISPATDRINNFASVMNEPGPGTYRYWVDDVDALKKAFEADHGVDLAAKDGADGGDSPPPPVIEGLHWKKGVGGAYQALPGTFNPNALATIIVEER
jgi:hypothetical protein